ncbi:MAG: hypothetical protein QG616_759 [Pseudomonadota bacterium]|nr:hypothetical protein [Pseudomonadota bacterium]
MGSLVFFPTDRFGAVTRNTEQPHPVERLAAWLRKAAHIREALAKEFAEHAARQRREVNELIDLTEGA